VSSPELHALLGAERVRAEFEAGTAPRFEAAITVAVESTISE
jgi:hypothetical protein